MSQWSLCLGVNLGILGKLCWKIDLQSVDTRFPELTGDRKLSSRTEQLQDFSIDRKMTSGYKIDPQQKA